MNGKKDAGPAAVLPRGRGGAPVAFPWFTDAAHACLWRNWGMIEPAELARLLRCSETDLRREAAAMDLDPAPQVDPAWRKRSYLSLIRQNWHLLDYDQLLELLDWPAERLERVLNEEDFLFHKMGRSKPVCPEAKLVPATGAAAAQLAEWAAIHRELFPAGSRRRGEPIFGFERHFTVGTPPTGKPLFDFNYIHPYCAGCGDLLIDIESADPAPEPLLAAYASRGVKGIWLHSILHLLYPMPGEPAAAQAAAETRLANLHILARRCRKHGLGLYLYWNEPRGVPDAMLKELPTWRGVTYPEDGITSICTGHTPEPLAWLEAGARAVFAAAPELAGVFMIEMSENATHCNARFRKAECPWCRERDGAAILAEIYAAVERGVHAAAPEARVIAEDWAWKAAPDDAAPVVFKRRVIDLLPPRVTVLSISEWGLPTHVGGVTGQVIDYSISQPGPAPEAVAVWRHARATGHETAAKIQLNNSWELSAVPYLPVPHLVREHLEKIAAEKVDGVMLSWTLGGYPGGNFGCLYGRAEEPASAHFRPETAAAVTAALAQFSAAFHEFPFHLDVIYTAPVNAGPRNPLWPEPTGYKATMTGFPYDDLTTWRGIYPEAVFAEQFEKVAAGWEKGLAMLEAIAPQPEEAAELAELRRVAAAAACHFRSTADQIAFVRGRDGGAAKSELAALLLRERETARKLHALAAADSRIGFEASNHYFYTLNELREKAAACEWLRRRY